MVHGDALPEPEEAAGSWLETAAVQSSERRKEDLISDSDLTTKTEKSIQEEH